MRDDVLIQRDALSAEDLAFLAEFVQQAPMTDSLVSDFEDAEQADALDWVVNTNVRNTQELQLSSAVSVRLNRILDAGVRQYIDPFFCIEVRDREPIQVLHYGVGGHYIPHVDSETLFTDEGGLEMWEKTLDRDLSVVYFLNDDFSGGELVFPHLDLVIKAEAGTLVCFPSDHNYIHGVDTVISGHRYTAVTWMRVKGMPALEEINQAAFAAYNEMWPQQIEQPSRLGRGGIKRL